MWSIEETRATTYFVVLGESWHCKSWKSEWTQWDKSDSAMRWSKTEVKGKGCEDQETVSYDLRCDPSLFYG